MCVPRRSVSDVLVYAHCTPLQLGFWDLYYNRYLKKENYLPSNVDILSTPWVFRLLVNTLRRRGIDYDTIDERVQSYLDAYMKKQHQTRSREYFKQYRPYDEMMKFMRRARYRCKGRCSLFTIGQSYEGRALMGIKIGTSKHRGENQKRNIWIDAGTHSREWISHTTALYLVDMLITGYTQDRFVRHMVDTYDWYILPCVNPDGYNYTWTTNRRWRKTRRPISGSDCFGVDINRNFGFKWGHSGSSTNPCSSNYRGNEPYSEPETKAIVDFIQSASRKDTWLMYITLHSKDRSSGTSRDWAYGEADIPYVYTFELRDRGRSGWKLPPSHIIPAGEEVWAGLETSIRAIEELKSNGNMAKLKSNWEANHVIKAPSRSRSRHPTTW
ncbi:hypothetical protein LSH36_104g04002 [Paralvinella palmiformis]|uniref:Peptidase M14 domain-containing protein n=1 Tax=Paralvinella palmiformis TaxID=53620 RepID=A0AAD9K0F1_9ANNE|nr:hypothetical protein LSH36_104g04002 [Paralvinella palmiformis]